MADPAPASKIATPPEPLRGYNFKLEIDTYTGYFHTCRGLSVEVGFINWREGGDPNYVRRLAGPVDFPTVTLSYGLIVNAQEQLWNWLASAMTGAPDRKRVSIMMLDNQRTEVLRYNLLDAFPVGWSAPDLDALGKTVAIESLSLVYESIERSV